MATGQSRHIRVVGVVFVGFYNYAIGKVFHIVYSIPESVISQTKFLLYDYLMKAKPILFIDFDGTICFDKYWRSLPKDKFDQMQSFMFGEDKTLVNDWMRGKYTAEEINQLVAEKIDMSFEKLWELFVLDCKTMEVSREILEKLSAIRDKYTVILITGNMDSFTRFTVPVLQLEKYFDYINNSFFETKLKDDDNGSLFTKYAKSLGVSLNKCILIDNSQKACESFRALGGTAYFITPEHGIMMYLENLS